jgi:hypothetical protein
MDAFTVEKFAEGLSHKRPDDDDFARCCAQKMHSVNMRLSSEIVRDHDNSVRGVGLFTWCDIVGQCRVGPGSGS